MPEGASSALTRSVLGTDPFTVKLEGGRAVNEQLTFLLVEGLVGGAGGVASL